MIATRGKEREVELGTSFFRERSWIPVFSRDESSALEHARSVRDGSVKAILMLCGLVCGLNPFYA